MRIVGLIRVKNEARWIEHVLDSIRPFCDPIIVLDDHSTDDTPEMCEASGATVIRSEATEFDEAADKDLLAAKAHEAGADWCYMIDGDEVLDPSGVPILRAAMERGDSAALKFPYLYLWNDFNHIRVDGAYANFWRESAWRSAAGQRFKRTQFGGNMHCSSVPEGFTARAKPCQARILHLGYMQREDRIRKLDWYTDKEVRCTGHLNELEDYYRHMIMADNATPDEVPQMKRLVEEGLITEKMLRYIIEVPATAKLRYGGPLRLEALT